MILGSGKSCEHEYKYEYHSVSKYLSSETAFIFCGGYVLSMSYRFCLTIQTLILSSSLQLYSLHLKTCVRKKHRKNCECCPGNSLTVSLCLSLSLNLNRCLCSHCSYCSHCSHCSHCNHCSH